MVNKKLLDFSGPSGSEPKKPLLRPEIEGPDVQAVIPVNWTEFSAHVLVVAHVGSDCHSVGQKRKPRAGLAGAISC